MIGPIVSSTFRRGRAFVRSEWLVLAILALSSGLLLAFLSLADEVVEGETQAFDNGVLRLFRNPNDVTDVIGPLWVEEAVRDITALGSYAVLIILVLGVVIYLTMIRRRAAAAVILISVAGGMILSTVLKISYARPRPDLTSISHQFTASFPSGHAMLSAVTYLTLGAILMQLVSAPSKRIFIMAIAVFLTILIGVSRLYLGVHYPTDVLAGWSLGAAWAFLCSAAAVWLQRRGRVEEPGETTEAMQASGRDPAP